VGSVVEEEGWVGESGGEEEEDGDEGIGEEKHDGKRSDIVEIWEGGE